MTEKIPFGSNGKWLDSVHAIFPGFSSLSIAQSGLSEPSSGLGEVISMFMRLPCHHCLRGSPGYDENEILPHIRPILCGIRRRCRIQ
jgi:hypothetical protein